MKKLPAHRISAGRIRWQAIQGRLLPGLELVAHDRFAFYDRCLDRDVCLVIATGEQRLYANILLTIGVVNP